MAIEHFLLEALEWVVPICEIIAVIVILVAVGTAFFYYIRNIFTPDEKDVKINLISGLSIGLEFAMAAEILKTIQKHDLMDLALLGAVIVMRVILAFAIHYELKDHKKMQMGLHSHQHPHHHVQAHPHPQPHQHETTQQ